MSAEEHKSKGSAAFAAKNYAEAVAHFTAAIELDPTNHVLYSNRAACYTSLRQFDKALQDADATIKLKPDWAKGYSRKGAAAMGLGDYADALKAFEDGLKIEPGNEALKEGFNDAEARLREQMFAQSNNGMGQIGALFAAPGAIQKLQMHPKTAPLLRDPAFRAKLEMVAKNPAALSNAFDEKMIQCMAVLMSLPGADGMDTGEDEPKEANGGASTAPTSAPEPEPEKMEEDEPDLDPELKAKKQEAEKLKEQGTEAYKKKDFAKALEFYVRAAEADPTDMVYLLNQGAVYLEQQEYDKCIEVCKKAVEVGIDHRADYKTVAKTYARIAKAYSLKKEFKEAVHYCDKALANHRSQDYIQQKKQAEKELKEQERLNYIDPVKGQEAKERGNELFKKGDYPAAVKEYTDAIKRDPKNATYYSNRAAAYTKLTELGLALKDCEECVALDPKFIKGYLRKGNILLAMKKPSDARKAFEKAMELDKDHPEAVEGFQKAMMAEAGIGMSEEERREMALKDPEVQAILGDPVMQNILQQMTSDPRAIKDHLANPVIREKIFKLQQAGILRIA